MEALNAPTPETSPVHVPSGGAPWSHVAIAPVDSWVDLGIKAEPIPAKEGYHLTYLLWGRQVNAEARKSFHCTSLRLETAVAVQHQSQWHVDLDPRFHHLTLHWLRLVRDGKATDCLQRERMRLIQRETQLERHVLDGTWTLLVVLDDVRPGDIIEAGYSFTHRHPIRHEGCEEFFFVPPQIVIGRYFLTVLFEPSRRTLAWKASSDAPALETTAISATQIRWSWSGSQQNPREGEANQPSAFLDYVWMQISDLASWAELSATIARAWDQHASPVPGAELPYAKPALVDKAAVTTLIRQVQDDFRYLSVDLETGGWIPTEPGAVSRRRYGDCKDLVWMTATILRSWGVAARPILVGTGLRQAVASLLPMSHLFNHAVLEVTVDGESRWFDLTLRSQGGPFKESTVNWYGFGLAVDPAAKDLAPQTGERSPSRYIVRETLFVDTRKAKPSLVERRIRAEGWQADIMRARRLSAGVEDFNKDRLEEAKRRFGKAKSSGQIRWRDDRDENVCELIEEYEIDEMLYSSPGDQRALFDVPQNLIFQSFALPGEKPRRAPWDLPYPLEVRHRITILHKTLGSGRRVRRSWGGPEVTALLEETLDEGEWSKTAWFIVNRDDVAPERIAHFRAELEKFFVAASWRLHMPWEEGRPNRWCSTGELPDPKSGQSAYVPAAHVKDFSPASDEPEGAVPSSRVSWSKQEKFPWWALAPILILLSTALRNCAGPS